jgi:hypothetical protein
MICCTWRAYLFIHHLVLSEKSLKWNIFNCIGQSRLPLSRGTEVNISAYLSSCMFPGYFSSWQLLRYWIISFFIYLLMLSVAQTILWYQMLLHHYHKSLTVETILGQFTSTWLPSLEILFNSVFYNLSLCHSGCLYPRSSTKMLAFFYSHIPVQIILNLIALTILDEE